MATFFQSVRQGFGRGSNKSNNNNQQKINNGSQNTSQTSLPPVMPNQMPPLTNSPSLSSTYSVETGFSDEQPKYFFREKYAKCSVKGNFLTLAAQPKNVEKGEWLAHQVVEQNRLLIGLIQVIQEVDTNTGLTICNELTCPTMSAGRITFTWLENGRPAKIPAPAYISRVQKWLVGKIHDPVTFPTDPDTGSASTFASGDVSTLGATTPIAMGPTSLNAPLSTLAGANDWVGKSSGFPQNFLNDIKSIMKQMFRCYAHLYHGHWLDPFYNINRHLELNSCFVHFITIAMYYDLLAKKEMQPMRPLIDIFIRQSLIPADAVANHTS